MRWDNRVRMAQSSSKSTHCGTVVFKLLVQQKKAFSSNSGATWVFHSLEAEPPREGSGPGEKYFLVHSAKGGPLGSRVRKQSRERLVKMAAERRCRHHDKSQPNWIPSLFRDVTQCGWVVRYRRFGTNCRFRLQVPSSPKRICSWSKSSHIRRCEIPLFRR